MNSSRVLLIVQSLLILIGSTNAASTRLGSLEDLSETFDENWDDFSGTGDEGTPETPSFDWGTSTDEPVDETDYGTSGEQTTPSPLPSHVDAESDGFRSFGFYPSSSGRLEFDSHLKAPTSAVVQFAQVRNEMSKNERAMQARSNKIDTRITELIKGSIADLHRNTQNNNALIKVETDNRVVGIRSVHRFAEDQISLVREEVAGVKSNLQKMRQAVRTNRARQETALQNYGAATNKHLVELKKELDRQFRMISDLEKVNADPN